MKIRQAKRTDIPAIVKMLADDKLGAQREDFRDPLPKSYYDAFDHINSDPKLELLIVESDHEQILATFQMAFIRDMTYQGGTRAQIEAVRVKKEQKGKGVGQFMFKWAIERAKKKGAHLLQLTTDKQRPEAKHFYEKMGFQATHEGMKMWLNK